MKSLKLIILGIGIGIIELIVIIIISTVWKIATFENLAFGFGVVTLLLGMLALFGDKRVRTGMNMFPGNSVAQSSFQSDVTFQETKLVKKMSSLPYRVRNTLPIFIAAATVFIGFGVSLVF